MAAEKGFDPVPPTLVIREEVDRGSFGVVYLATLDKKSVAVKQFHKALMTNVGPGENVHLKNFRTECEQLKDLNHPNVVRYIGAYEDKKGPLLVMELMYESLEKYLKRNKGRLSPERVLDICSAVCEGMAYLHGRDKPLIHRDLGSKNVLLTKEGIVKIADFGQSKLLQNCTGSLMTTQPGTITYMPPEALKKGGEYTAKVDSFSLGVLLLEICTQSLPSSGWEGINYMIEVIRHEKDLSLLDDAHPLKPLVVWCLQHEKLRPAVAVIHKYVQNVCEKSKIIATLEECLRAKDKAVKDLEGRLEVVILEKEAALKEERDRMEKNLRVKTEKLELEKEAWQNLIITTKNKNTALNEELDKAIGQYNDEQREWYDKMDKVEQDRRVAVDEAKDLNKEMKHLQESLEKERAEKIEQLQADLSKERKDRESAVGEFADREKEWMEQIKMIGEERDHLKALNMQLQDQTNHQKHEMERLERELKESRGIADGIAKKMTNQEASFKKQEASFKKQDAEHRNQVLVLHRQLEKLNREVAKLKAELTKKKDAKGSKAIEEAYGRLFDEKNSLECKVLSLTEAKSIASQHIMELQRENQTLRAEVEGTKQHLLRASQELHGFRTQYQALSSQTITLRDENEKLKQRMATSQRQQQVTPHPIPADESSYQSLPQMPSGPGQIVRQDYRPHLPHGGMPRPQYGDMSRPPYGNGTRPQHDEMQYRPYGGSPHSQDRDLEEKDSPPNSTQPGHAHLVPYTDPVTRTPIQDPRNPPCTGGGMGTSPVIPYAPQTVPGVPQGGILQLGLSDQQQQQQQHCLTLPRAHSTPERQESDVSSDSVLPSPMTSRPGQASREGITAEIKMKADWLKRNPEDEVYYDAPDDIEEGIWSFDPNLECPHCGKRFRRGQIREYRYHLDDEHAP